MAPPDDSSGSVISPDDRLDSWKEIAAFLKRDVTTVQRWEKREGMPVHRHLHDKMGSVYALRTELDAWAQSRKLAVGGLGAPAQLDPLEPDAPSASIASRRRWLPVVALMTLTVIAVTAVMWRLNERDFFWKNPLADAKFVQVTDLDGPEQSAAISRDGKFVAFLANRDGRVSVWVTQVGTGQFRNLTGDPRWDLTNPSVRTLGFSPDGALVTFWTRKANGSSTPDIGIWAAPILGGEPRPYLDGAAEFDWSSDASRVVYHTPGPGDPMFVKDPQRTSDSRPIFAAPPGLHSHFLAWSMDQAYVYFVQGTPPEPMDVWRIRPTGGAPERITHHESRVSHPVFLNPRTLLYLATDSSGSGPWLYEIDVERRLPHRVSSGIEAYSSLSASADGRRLVATTATARTTLWRLTSSGAAFDSSSASSISLSTGSGFSPRVGPGYLLYVSSQGARDSIWKRQSDATTELWTATDARVLGAALDPDGRRIAFSTRQGGRVLLYVMNADGTGARIIDQSLEWQGDPAWTPDGRSITAAALDGGVPHLFTVSLDGKPPARLGDERALDPVWSPDGRFVVFSGADIGTTFPVKAMTADGRPYRLPDLTLSRGARHLRFLPAGRALVVLKGETGHKDLWSVDLETGAEHQLTTVAPEFEIRDFDLSADGRELVLERGEAHSAVVLLDLPAR